MTPRQKNPATEVYVISTQNGFVKIGISADSQRRLQSLQISSSEKLELVHVCRDVGQPRLVEGIAHSMLAGHHSHGEWFMVSREKAIKAVSDAASVVKTGIVKSIREVTRPQVIKRRMLGRKGNKGGRPRKDPSELRVDLRMRVPPEFKTAVERAAKAAGQSVTAWMEQAGWERLGTIQSSPRPRKRTIPRWPREST